MWYNTYKYIVRDTKAIHHMHHMRRCFWCHGIVLSANTTRPLTIPICNPPRGQSNTLENDSPWVSRSGTLYCVGFHLRFCNFFREVPGPIRYHHGNRSNRSNRSNRTFHSLTSMVPSPQRHKPSSVAVKTPMEAASDHEGIYRSALW
jgi:hypothetical protein